jgi:hypothetical protein
MRTAFILAAASALHSVHRSSKAFLEGADGLPTPNVGHYERDPFVCFVEGEGGGGEGGQGGGGGSASSSEGAPKFDDAQQKHINGMLAKERRAAQAKIEEATKAQAARDAEFNELKAKLEQFEIEKNEAKLSEKERLEKAAERERNTWSKRLAETEAAKAAAEKAAADKDLALRDTHTDYKISTALGKLKIAPSAAEDAPAAFKRAATIEYDAKGNIASIEVDGDPYTSLEEAAAAWLKKRPHFEAAPVGGAGSRASTGSATNKPAYLRSTEENLAAANEQRGRVR